MNDFLFEEYEHHGAMVTVRRGLKGTHRQHCLCFTGCAKFKPGQPDNCPRAQELYDFCMKYNMTTPVFECGEYEMTACPVSVPLLPGDMLKAMQEREEVMELAIGTVELKEFQPVPEHLKPVLAKIVFWGNYFSEVVSSGEHRAIRSSDMWGFIGWAPFMRACRELSDLLQIPLDQLDQGQLILEMVNYLNQLPKDLIQGTNAELALFALNQRLGIETEKEETSDVGT